MIYNFPPILNKKLPSKIEPLNSIRFMMIWMIAIGHIILFYGCSKDSFIYTHFVNTNVAVNYFFILSGFGLTYGAIYKNESIELPSLKSCILKAIKRISKLYLLYILTMAFMVVLRLNESLLSNIHQICNFIFSTTLLQSISCAPEFAMMLNAPCWFFSTLFILYILYPMLAYVNIALINKLYTKGKLHKVLPFISLIGILLCTSAKILWGELDSLTNVSSFAYVNPLMQIFPFILGILLCDTLFYQKWEIKLPTLWEIFIISVCLIWFITCNAEFKFINNSIKHLINYIIPSVIIFFFSIMGGGISKILKTKIVNTLGNLSMYIFILHWPIAEFIIRATKRFGIFEYNRISILVIIIFLIMGLSLLAHFFTQRKMNLNHKN